MIQDATHKIVDALLTLIFREVLWPCHDRIFTERLSICWLWAYAVAEPLEYTWCNTQKRWHSVDTLLTLCWHCVDTVLMLWWRSVDAVLTLCWWSFWGVTVLTNTILPTKAANTSIMDKCRSTALGLYNMQHTKSLTLWWRSFSDRCCDHVTITSAQNGCQHVDYGSIPSQSLWIIHDTTPKSVDTLLLLGCHCVDARLTLWWCSLDTLLTLCWHSFWGVMVSTHTILPIQGANTSIMDKCHSTALGLYMVQHTKSLTLWWRSFPEWGCDHVAITFAQNSCQYVDYGYLP